MRDQLSDRRGRPSELLQHHRCRLLLHQRDIPNHALQLRRGQLQRECPLSREASPAILRP